MAGRKSRAQRMRANALVRSKSAQRRTYKASPFRYLDYPRDLQIDQSTLPENVELMRLINEQQAEQLGDVFK